MTPIEAKQLKKWLDDNDALMLAFVELGSFIVLIRSANAQHIGVGESATDFEVAVREAQHSFDIKVFREAHTSARIVGQA